MERLAVAHIPGNYLEEGEQGQVSTNGGGFPPRTKLEVDVTDC